MGSASAKEHIKHSTNVVYVVIIWILTVFWEICDTLVVKSAPELNFLMRNGVPKLGVDPGLEYWLWSTWASLDA